MTLSSNQAIYKTGQINFEKQLQKQKNDRLTFITKVQRLTIVLKALIKAKKYQHFKSTIKSIYQYQQLSQANIMMKQYLNHCAIVIQSRFRGYQQRKYYKMFLPIYRRFKELLISVVEGWKVRKVMNLPSFKKKIGQIKSFQKKGKLMNMRILKRQFVNDVQRYTKYGLWVNQTKKINLAKIISLKTKKQETNKNSQENNKNSIKNIFNRTIKLKSLIKADNLDQKNHTIGTKGNKKNNSQQLQKTKRVANNKDKQQQQFNEFQNMEDHNVYVHDFDYIPIKGSNNINDFEKKIQEEIQKQQMKNNKKGKIKQKASKPVESKKKSQKIIKIEQKHNNQSQNFNDINEHDRQSIKQMKQSTNANKMVQTKIAKKKTKLSVISKQIKNSLFLSQSLINSHNYHKQEFIQNVSIKEKKQMKLQTKEQSIKQAKNFMKEENSIKNNQKPIKEQTQKKSIKKKEIQINIRPFDKNDISNNKSLISTETETKKSKNIHIQVKQLLQIYNASYAKKKQEMNRKFQQMKRRSFQNRVQFK